MSHVLVRVYAQIVFALVTVFFLFGALFSRDWATIGGTIVVIMWAQIRIITEGVDAYRWLKQQKNA